jgi:hypothetical protein
MKVAMSCNQQPLLRRLAVDEPALLDTAPWRTHLEACETCRRERYSLNRSLAVFRQVAALPAGASPQGPSWEAFSRTLDRQRRHHSRLRVRVPLAAASLLVAVSTGVLFWPVAQEQETPRPARIIRVQPEQQVQMQSMLRSTLHDPPATLAGAGTSHESPVRGETPATRFSLQASEPQAGAPLLVAEEPVLPVAAPANDFPRISFGRRDGERAPVLLFRSLQQQERGRQAPIQVLPVFAPTHRDPGSLLPRALLLPLPIR